MTQQEPFDVDRAAVVIMDFQNGIVGGFASDPQGTAERAASVLAAARAAGIPVVHVVHRGGRFADDSPDVEIHPGVAPAGGSASSPRRAQVRSRPPGWRCYSGKWGGIRWP